MKKPRSRLPISKVVFALIIFLYIIGFIMYPRLPDMVPSHWNVSGEVDGYMPKKFYVIFFPSLTLGLYLLMSLAPIMDPRPESYNKFRGVFEGFRIILVLVFTVIYIATLLFALGMPISIAKIINLSLGIMFIFIGNYFGKIRHNYTFGIKTPWTLANEEIWNKTHRVSGPLWVAVGFIWIFSIFLLTEKLAFSVNMVALLLASGFGFIYSFILFKQLKN